MKTIMHPDYWVEIPAGEFLTGLSGSQQLLIGQRLRKQVHYEHFSTEERQLVESVVAKMRRRTEHDRATGKIDVHYRLELSDDEDAIWSLDPFRTIIDIERQLLSIPTQKSIWLDRYYIARFPITSRQAGKLLDRPASRTPGALTESTFDREVDVVSGDEPAQLCERLGARLPTKNEWEKAARGTDGRFYPWGNDWDPAAGYFYYGQRGANLKRVDAFPRGVSPYGVWAMAGGLPEFVTYLKPQPHRGWKGCYARESSPETAWLDHLVSSPGEGQWVSLRPVLDKWPRQQWRGFRAGLEEPDAEALQKMGLLADLVLTQYDWLGIVEKPMRQRLEPAIVALREGRKAEAKSILAEMLQQEADTEIIWLLQAAALEELSQQHESLEQALALNPDSEVGQKMAAILLEPACLRGDEAKTSGQIDLLRNEK